MVAFAPTSAAGARAIKASAFFPAISPLLGARFGRRPAFVAGEFAVQRRTLGSMRTRRPAAAPAKSRLVDLKFPHPPLLRYPNTGAATADCGLQMSFTRYEWDVFLSYAHVDDVADVDRKGWVRHLYENVRDRLHRRLGGTPPKIFFDETSVAANHQLDRLCSAARKSAVFLAVTSTNYADRPWTKKELDAFIDSNPWNESNETQLFAVECLDPEDRSLLPHPLDNHIGAYLWEDYGSGCRSLRPGTDDYIRAIDKLVNEIAEKLKELRSAPPPPPAPPAVDAGRTVLLAQPTGDLEEAADQVRSHLGQYRHRRPAHGRISAGRGGLPRRLHRRPRARGALRPAARAAPRPQAAGPAGGLHAVPGRGRFSLRHRDRPMARRQSEARHDRGPGLP